MKYWISKYALEKGVFSVQGDKLNNGSIYVESMYPCHLDKGEYHETKASARCAAEEMRTKKIASLRKQIERLERMEF